MTLAVWVRHMAKRLTHHADADAEWASTLNVLVCADQNWLKVSYAEWLLLELPGR